MILREPPEGSMCCGMLIDTTDSHSSLLPFGIRENGVSSGPDMVMAETYGPLEAGPSAHKGYEARSGRAASQEQNIVS